MQSVFDIKIGYSERFADIMEKQFRGDCTVHLLCMAGEGVFTFNGKRYVLHKNDCAVISHTHLIEVVEDSEYLKVEMVSAPLSFLRNQLPANNYGIGGSLALSKCWYNRDYHNLNIIPTFYLTAQRIAV